MTNKITDLDVNSLYPDPPMSPERFARIMSCSICGKIQNAGDLAAYFQDRSAYYYRRAAMAETYPEYVTMSREADWSARSARMWLWRVINAEEPS